MVVLKILSFIVGLCFAAAVAVAALAWRSSIDPIARPEAKGFEAENVKHGAVLAAMGDCKTCHTVPGGRPFAGGLRVPTPFGSIYSTNITPDPSTGIGSWSEQAFRRALREGVDREGRQLYPAFPYDHFTLLSDEDIAALYAFLMTREAVPATAPPNELPFPLSIRPIIAGWKLLFFREGPYRADPSRGETQNRGAYLVAGIAHCGACHTPRNALGEEATHDAFAGGDVEGWAAYALNAASPSPLPWSSDALRTYLRHGWQRDHGVASGPMAPVIDNLAAVPESDLAAMVTYLSGLLGEPSAERLRTAKARIERAQSAPELGALPVDWPASGQPAGALIYRSACASCHDSARPPPYGGINLALSTAPNAPDARNVINIVLWGVPPAAGERSPIMPGFANVLSDQQLGQLLDYLRSQFSGKPAWTNLEQDIREARNLTPSVPPPPARAANTGAS
ncbi:MAG TPA: cytochrome c [Xanthobacteraceae bacterium]|jgi:mono/diheme cytochrome c family protein